MLDTSSPYELQTDPVCAEEKEFFVSKAEDERKRLKRSFESLAQAAPPSPTSTPKSLYLCKSIKLDHLTAIFRTVAKLMRKQKIWLSVSENGISCIGTHTGGRCRVELRLTNEYFEHWEFKKLGAVKICPAEMHSRLLVFKKKPFVEIDIREDAIALRSTQQHGENIMGSLFSEKKGFGSIQTANYANVGVAECVDAAPEATPTSEQFYPIGLFLDAASFATACANIRKPKAPKYPFISVRFDGPSKVFSVAGQRDLLSESKDFSEEWVMPEGNIVNREDDASALVVNELYDTDRITDFVVGLKTNYTLEIDFGPDMDLAITSKLDQHPTDDKLSSLLRLYVVPRGRKSGGSLFQHGEDSEIKFQI